MKSAVIRVRANMTLTTAHIKLKFVLICKSTLERGRVRETKIKDSVSRES